MLEKHHGSKYSIHALIVLNIYPSIPNEPTTFRTQLLSLIKGTAFLSDRQEGLLRDVLKSEVMPEDTAATTNTRGQNRNYLLSKALGNLKYA